MNLRLLIVCICLQMGSLYGSDVIADYLQITKSNLKRDRHKHHHKRSFGLKQARVLGNFAQKNETCGFNGSIGYSFTHYGMDHFHVHNANFNNLLLSIGGYRDLCPDWSIDGNVSVQTNVTHIARPEYSFLQATLEARYQWFEKFALYFGVNGLAGMHYNKLQPILGFSYRPCTNLVITGIYPKTLTVFYTLTPTWTLTAAFRNIISAQRLNRNQHERFQKAAIVYRNLGAEVGVVLNFKEHLQATFSIGEAIDSKIWISEHHDKRRIHHKLENTPYFSASIGWNF